MYNMPDSRFLQYIRDKTSQHSTIIILSIIIIITLVFRLSGILWSLPPFDIKNYHPDEYKIINGAYDFPQDITKRDDLRYPTGLHYTIGILSWPLKKAVEASRYHKYTYVSVHLAGRLLSILFGTSTILLVYFLAKQYYDEKLALISAAIISLSMYHVINSTWATTDVATSFFLTLLFLLLKPTYERRTLRYEIFSGAVLGMLVGIKYTGVFAVFGLVAYFMLRNAQELKIGLVKNIRSIITGRTFWSIGITAIVVFLLSTPVIWLRFEIFTAAMEWEQARLAQHDTPIYNFRVWKDIFVSLTKTVGIPLAILSCLGLMISFIRKGAYEISAAALVLLYFLIFGDALIPRYIIMLLPLMAIMAARSLLFFYPWQSSKLNILNYLVIGLVLVHAFTYTLSAVLSRYPDTRSIAFEYIRENIPRGSEMGIAYTSLEYGWSYHSWRYPKTNFNRYEYVDFLEYPEYLLVSSYDAEQIKETLQSDILFKGYEFPSVYDNQWYRNSPPSPDIFRFYDQLYFKDDTPYELIYRISPYNPNSQMEFPSPTIEIFKLTE
jgi:hypothetical protein